MERVQSFAFKGVVDRDAQASFLGGVIENGRGDGVPVFFEEDGLEGDLDAIGWPGLKRCRGRRNVLAPIVLFVHCGRKGMVGAPLAVFDGDSAAIFDLGKIERGGEAEGGTGEGEAADGARAVGV